MRLKSVYVRFFKAFNHDYLRKIDAVAQAGAKPWEIVDDRFYPFVRIDLDPKVTTVVGANESGKSQLLGAIERGLTGREIKDEDLCRYSPFFSVERERMRQPDFGCEWTDLTPLDRDRLRAALELKNDRTFDSLHLFRLDGGELVAYLPGDDHAHRLTAKRVADLLPRSFRINAGIALPDSVAISTLLGIDRGASAGEALGFGRKERADLLDLLVEQGGVFAGVLRVLSGGGAIATAEQKSGLEQLAGLLSPSAGRSDADQRKAEGEARLAYDLLFKVAGVDRRALEGLARALREGSDGYASALCDGINQQLATRLNFPRVWAQDSHFALLVTPRERELVFTIRDRTGRQYTFNERSGGLKFFLSYYIQYLAHEPSGPDTEILLMDEPDAYLSSQAQQDLLRGFNAFAEGENRRKPVQVVYVTHSPFLIDRNHGERIRVLEKGVGDEGTRVVNRGSRNHYEPLRSSFGAFFAETASIGNCNLIVEGPGDQIILAAGAHLLRSRPATEAENLDLNRLTIVPAGGAANVPYTVYLAHGRGPEHPAVVVLLDSDKEGDRARRLLAREPIRGKRLLDDALAFQVGELGPGPRVVTAHGRTPVEIEDLIPLTLCLAAARRYATEFWAMSPAQAAKLTPKQVQQKFDGQNSIFDALSAATHELYGEDQTMDKVGFARLVSELLAGRGTPAAEDTEATQVGLGAARDEFAVNMRALFGELSSRQHRAEKELTVERVSGKIERIKRRFFQDHPVGSTRERAGRVLKELHDALDPSEEGDQARTLLDALKRDHHLEEDLTQPVIQFDEFNEGLQRVRYAAANVQLG